MMNVSDAEYYERVAREAAWKMARREMDIIATRETAHSEPQLSDVRPIEALAAIADKKTRKNGCIHGRKISMCKECGGRSRCPHFRDRYRCKDCGGKGICEHGKQRHQCKECKAGVPSDFCSHNVRESECKYCTPIPPIQYCAPVRSLMYEPVRSLTYEPVRSLTYEPTRSLTYERAAEDVGTEQKTQVQLSRSSTHDSETGDASSKTQPVQHSTHDSDVDDATTERDIHLQSTDLSAHDSDAGDLTKRHITVQTAAPNADDASFLHGGVKTTENGAQPSSSEVSVGEAINKLVIRTLACAQTVGKPTDPEGQAIVPYAESRGSSTCVHGEDRARCRKCDGRPRSLKLHICPHNRQLKDCKECRPNDSLMQARDTGETTTPKNIIARAVCSDPADGNVFHSRAHSTEGGMEPESPAVSDNDAMNQIVLRTIAHTQTVVKDACPHGNLSTACAECRGQGILVPQEENTAVLNRRVSGTCPHGRKHYSCKECGGKGVCQHNRMKSQCRQCGKGRAKCPHNRERNRCLECGGNGVCPRHGRHWGRCKECVRPPREQTSAPRRCGSDAEVGMELVKKD